MIELQSTTSTNDEAVSLIKSGQAWDGLVVWAREQTKGRGRRGRQWISPPGNLHCSMILDVAQYRAQAAQLGFVAAVALVDALAVLMPKQRFFCKWPNDVLVEDKKVAGMLLEAEGINWLVLGLGVDVAHCPPADLLDRPAISLAQLGYDGDAKAVLDGFCKAMIPWVEQWKRFGFTAIRQAWIDRVYGIGGPVTVRLEKDVIVGTFLDLDQDGALVMQEDGGGKRRILAGDVYMGGLGASGH